MKIFIKDIPANGMELTRDVEPAVIGLDDSDFKILPPLKVTGIAQRVDDTVIVHVEVNAKFVFTCSRCLEVFERSNLRELDFDYAVDDSMKVIDVGDDIRQELIMDLPVRVLCQEDCNGICAGCGANLNLEECKCK